MISITPSSYHCDRAHRALADQIMQRHQLDPNVVTGIDVIDEGWAIVQIAKIDDDGAFVVADDGMLEVNRVEVFG